MTSVISETNRKIAISVENVDESNIINSSNTTDNSNSTSSDNNENSSCSYNDVAEEKCNSKVNDIFINKLLGEMKCQFNRSDKKSEERNLMEESESNLSQKDVSPTKEEVDDIKEEVEEGKPDGDKPRIVLLFKKPGKADNSTQSKRNNTRNKDVDHPQEEGLKRSSRRRSKDCESVLQSAIARKEKSYNESNNKPQRLTRQLKPTKKILENLELAKQEKQIRQGQYLQKRRSSENFDNNLSGEELSNGSSMASSPKRRHKRSKSRDKKLARNSNITKKLKTDSDNESGSDSVAHEENNDIVKATRRSQRLSSRHKEEALEVEKNMDVAPSTAEQNYYANDPECSSVGAELIASRLCLCTIKTQLFVANQTDLAFCGAVDSISGKLVGCNRTVNCKKDSLMRPSSRVPYALFCELHRNRLLRHNCCPTCGIFCTQGNFVQCDSKHQYHKDCQISVGEVQCCPHCGLTTQPQEINIKLHSSQQPIFLPIQKSLSNATAKMCFVVCNNENRETSITPPLIDSNMYPPMDVDDVDEAYCENDLLEAVRNVDFQKLTIILGLKNIDFHFKIGDFNEGTILHYAAQQGPVEVVHMLVIAGLAIDALDKEQFTPLMLSVQAENNDIVQYLVKAGASITFKGTDGMTALHLAAKCGNLKACEILLRSANQHGIKSFVNCQDDGGWTSLVWACEHGHLEVVQYLLDAGADESIRDVEHNVALHWAAFSGSTKIMELLLNLRMDPNSTNAHGDTPLHIAAREDRYNSIVVLLARGANVGLVNKNNETPLDCVPEGGDSLKLISLNIQLQTLTEPDAERKNIILSNDISKGKETNPIQCCNLFDNEPYPTDFVYITKSYITSNSIFLKNKLTDLNGCKCDENSRCIAERCSCGTTSIKCWYDKEGKLGNDFSYSDSPMIFECNDACSCNAITCNNRTVQRGTAQRFQIYKTESKGWGLQTLRFIAKGTFVCEYVGEILTDLDADRRDDDSFLFDLDAKEAESYCIDAKYYGNFTRFINHSCNPNLHPVKVFIEHQDLRFPRVAFFASRDIMADEELSFDYGDKFWMIKYKIFSCRCDSYNCKYSNNAM